MYVPARYGRGMVEVWLPVYVPASCLARHSLAQNGRGLPGKLAGKRPGCIKIPTSQCALVFPPHASVTLALLLCLVCYNAPPLKRYCPRSCRR